jgi:hypothetical protein
MKLLPTFLLALTISSSLTHAEDAPKGAGTGQGREKIKEMMVQRFDTNKNGTLDPDEKAAAMKAMQERRGGSPKGGTPGAPDAKGEAGKGGPMQAILLQKFDANKNGVLDPDEREAAMKAMQDRKGKSGGIPGAGPPTSEGGSKFRRPPEAPKESK